MEKEIGKEVPGEEPGGVPIVGRFVLYAAIVVLAVGLPAMSLLSGLSRARERAKAAVCRNNLKTIALARDMYRVERKMRPIKLSDLHPFFIRDLDVFVCPACGKRVIDPSRIGEESSYVVVNLTSIEKDEVAVYCRSCAPDGGRNVMLGDGRVVWMSQGDLDWALARIER